jgi:hypothetical protein
MRSEAVVRLIAPRIPTRFDTGPLPVRDFGLFVPLVPRLAAGSATILTWLLTLAFDSAEL